MTRIIAVVVAVLLAGASAQAAGPFDGTWTGSSTPPEGGCRGNLTVDMTISEGMISGEIVSDVPTPQGYTKGRLLPAGAIAPDGAVNVTIGSVTHYPAAFRFTGDRFVANMSLPCGTRTIAGTRSK